MCSKLSLHEQQILAQAGKRTFCPPRQIIGKMFFSPATEMEDTLSEQFALEFIRKEKAKIIIIHEIPVKGFK